MRPIQDEHTTRIFPFYFYGNSELSIPVCALGRSDVEVAVTLAPFSNLTFVSNISSLNQFMSMTTLLSSMDFIVN
jgi:hypothetical protein